jgi:uncharacterized protein YggT (Ycf19 family)
VSERREPPDPRIDDTRVHRTVTPRTPQDEPAVGREAPAGPDGFAIARRVASLAFALLLALLALRIVLLAVGTDQANAPVDLLYGLTDPFVAPFRSLFSIDEVRPAGRAVLDTAALVAAFGWTLVFVLVIAVLRLPER